MRIRLVKPGLSFSLVVIIGSMIILTNSCTDPISTSTDFLLTIVGKVTDFDTGKPIEGATLKLYRKSPQGDETLGTATSNSSGDYKLTGKHNCSGIPQVITVAEGYLDWNVAVHCQEEQQTVDFELEPRQ